MEFVCKADLKRGGWTETLIHRLLGKPDALRPNPHHPRGAKMKLYLLSRVERAERSDDFRCRGRNRKRATASGRTS